MLLLCVVLLVVVFLVVVLWLPGAGLTVFSVVDLFVVACPGEVKLVPGAWPLAAGWLFAVGGGGARFVSGPVFLSLTLLVADTSWLVWLGPGPPKLLVPARLSVTVPVGNKVLGSGPVSDWLLAAVDWVPVVSGSARLLPARLG